jgi:hypothetical protein
MDASPCDNFQNQKVGNFRERNPLPATFLYCGKIRFFLKSASPVFSKGFRMNRCCFLFIASLASFGLVSFAPVHAQFGGQKKGGAMQQAGGMKGGCGQSNGGSTQTIGQTANTGTSLFRGSSTQSTKSNTNRTRTQNPFSQGSGTPSAFNQTTGMPSAFNPNLTWMYGINPTPSLQYFQNSQNFPNLNLDTSNGGAYSMVQYPTTQPGGNSPTGIDQFSAPSTGTSVPAFISSTQAGVPAESSSQRTTSAQRIQQRRTAAQAQNTQLLRFSGQ